MESFNEFMSNVLSKFPTSTGKSDWYDYEIVTATYRDCGKIGITRHKNTSLYESCRACEADKLEETHIEQIKELLEKHGDMQCFVRIMPEYFTATNKHIGYYARLQFEPIISAVEEE